MKKIISLVLSLALILSLSITATYAYGETVSKLTRPETAVMSYGGKLCADWNKVKKAEKYEIAYKTADSDKWTYKKKSETQFSVKAKAGVKYKLKVRAINGDTKSPWSYIRTITMKNGYKGSNNKHVALGWKGRFSSSMLQKTERMYKNHYTSKIIKTEKASRMIKLNVGKYDTCVIKNVYTAGTGKDTKDVKLNVKVYDQRYDKEKGVFSFDGSWWYEKNAGYYKNDIAYLLELKKNGVKTYKYLRVHYNSAKISDDSLLLEFRNSSRLCPNGLTPYVKEYLKDTKKEITFNGKTYIGTYENSSFWFYNTYAFDYYKCKEGEFALNEKTGRVEEFNFSLPAVKGKETAERLKAKALKLASEYINTDDYELSMKTSDHCSYFDFTRYIGENETTARLHIMYDPKGKLEYFHCWNGDVVDKMIKKIGKKSLNNMISKITSKDAEKRVLEKYEKKYSKDEDVKIELTCIATLKSGKPAAVYKVSSYERRPYDEKSDMLIPHGEDIIVSLN